MECSPFREILWVTRGWSRAGVRPEVAGERGGAGTVKG